MYTPRSQVRRHRSLLWADETMDEDSPRAPLRKHPWEPPLDLDIIDTVPEFPEERSYDTNREAVRIAAVLERYSRAVGEMEGKIAAGRWSWPEQMELSRAYSAVLESYTTRGKYLSARVARKSEWLIGKMAELMVRGSDMLRKAVAPGVTVSRLDPYDAEMRRRSLRGRKKALSVTLGKFEPAGGEFGEAAPEELEKIIKRSDARTQFRVARASAKAGDFEAMDAAVRTAGYALEKLPEKAAVTVLLYHVILARTDGALLASTKKNLPERYSRMMSTRWFSRAIADISREAKELLGARSM